MSEPTLNQQIAAIKEERATHVFSYTDQVGPHKGEIRPGPHRDRLEALDAVIQTLTALKKLDRLEFRISCELHAGILLGLSDGRRPLGPDDYGFLHHASMCLCRITEFLYAKDGTKLNLPMTKFRKSRKARGL